MPNRQGHFKPSVAAEKEFGRALRKIARVAGHIVEAHTHEERLENAAQMQRALEDYSKIIDPWAKRQAAKMLEKVKKLNAKHYKAQSKEMGKLIKLQVAESHVGTVANKLMNEQVNLIKSIPVRAGLRAQDLAQKAIFEGSRASEIAEQLKNSTNVAESSATLIARTEVARANASITEARATGIGATWYIWRTTMDGAERDSHAKMNGKPVEYKHPPHLIDGTTGHAGTFPNCRCYQDVQFDDFPG